MFEQYLIPDASNCLNLGSGQPGREYLYVAHSIFNDSSCIDLDLDVDVFQYGKKDGHDYFKNSIIKKYFNHLPEVNFDHIFMTNGVSQGVQLITSLHTNKTRVFVEELTYFIMLDHFKDCGYQIETFNLDNLSEFNDKLKDGDLIYIIPFCNNPTGKTITHGQLDEFIKTINKFDCQVLSDETYYPLISSENLDIKTLYLYSNKIVSLHTFSKIFAPAVRLGWLMTQSSLLIDKLKKSGFIDSGGSVNPLMGYIISRSIDCRIYDDYLCNIITSLKLKQELILSVLDMYPEYFQYEKPNGGYFIFVKSLKIDSDKLLEIAKSYGITFHQGWKFTTITHKDKYANYFRLSVSYYSYNDLLEYFRDRIDLIINHIKEITIDNKINIWVLGHRGRIGSLVCKELEKHRLYWFSINRDFNLDHISKNDIIVDVSSAEGTTSLLNKLFELGIYPKIIIGTTGFLPYYLINEYKSHNKIIVKSNFSEGVPLILDFLKNFNDTKWDSVTINEWHHTMKKDSPSGTAKTLANSLKDFFPTTNITINSVREGNIIGEHEIIFKNAVEMITIKHSALDRNIFAVGCVNLIKTLMDG